jgi:hypothetical protein
MRFGSGMTHWPDARYAPTESTEQSFHRGRKRPEFKTGTSSVRPCRRRSRRSKAACDLRLRCHGGPRRRAHREPQHQRALRRRGSRERAHPLHRGSSGWPRGAVDTPAMEMARDQKRHLLSERRALHRCPAGLVMRVPAHQHARPQVGETLSVVGFRFDLPNRTGRIGTIGTPPSSRRGVFTSRLDKFKNSGIPNETPSGSRSLQSRSPATPSTG